MAYRIARLNADAVDHLQLAAQLDAQRVELVARQRLGLRPVDERQVAGVLLEALTLQDVVQRHQPAQVRQRFAAQERRQPDQRAGAATPVLVQPRQVVIGGAVGLVEREVDHHVPGPRAALELLVGHRAHVLVDHLHLAPGATPVELVGDEQPAAVRDAQLLEQHLAHLLAPVARVVVGLGIAQHRLQIDAGDLDRQHRVQVVGELDLAHLAGPVAQPAQHLRALLARDRRAESAVVQCRQPVRRQALERLHLGHQRGQQQRLEQPCVVAQQLGRASLGQAQLEGLPGHAVPQF